MQGVYKVCDTISSVTTGPKTLIYITAPSTAVLELISAKVTAEDEDSSEMILIELNRIATLGTPTASATLTPKPTEEGSAASGCTVKAGITASEPTYDSPEDAIAKHGANKLAGWSWVPLPEERAYISPSDTVGLRVVDTIANSVDLSAEIVFREIGT